MALGGQENPHAILGIDIEMILEPAKEKYVARDFKEFIRISGMTHGRTSPFYPQSNGKIERCSRWETGEVKCGPTSSIEF